MVRTIASALTLAAIAATGASCASRPLVPEPGEVYARSGVSRARPVLPPDAHSEAGAAWLRSRRLVSLGDVEYDGLALPLISPDARFIATQVGPTPSWETVLAEPGAVASAGKIRVLRALPGEAAPLRLEYELPRGVLLGRSVSRNGFVVEVPATGASRRGIGVVEWETGRVERLTGEEADCAFGTLGPRGEVAYCRREVGGSAWSVVLRDADGAEHIAAMPGQSLVFPQIVDTPRGLVIYALVVAGEGSRSEPLKLIAFAAQSGEEPGRLMSLGSTALAPASTMFDAYQSVAALQTGGAGSAASTDASVVVFSALHDAAAIARVDEKGESVKIRPLVPGTFSATLSSFGGREGVVACTLADTFYLDVPGRRAAGGGRETTYRPALVWPRMGVIRRTGDAEWPYCAFFMETGGVGNRLEGVLVGGFEAGKVD